MSGFDRKSDHLDDHLQKNHTLWVDSGSEIIARLVVVGEIYPFVQLKSQSTVSKFYFEPRVHLKYSNLATLSFEYLVYHVGLDNKLMPMHQ